MTIHGIIKEPAPAMVEMAAELVAPILTAHVGEEDLDVAHEVCEALRDAGCLRCKPEHPTTLTAEADYAAAPVGTVAVREDRPERVWVRKERGWFADSEPGFTYSSVMAERGYATVLRWGWGE